VCEAVGLHDRVWVAEELATGLILTLLEGVEVAVREGRGVREGVPVLEGVGCRLGDVETEMVDVEVMEGVNVEREIEGKLGVGLELWLRLGLCVRNRVTEGVPLTVGVAVSDADLEVIVGLTDWGVGEGGVLDVVSDPE
jgi:hypothetical protein